MKQNTQKERDPRGRKTNPRGKLRSNGLLEDQWKIILFDANANSKEGAYLLREIIDVYCDKRLQDEASKQNLQPVDVMKKAVDFYIDAMFAQENRFANEAEFNKLQKQKPKSKK